MGLLNLTIILSFFEFSSSVKFYLTSPKLNYISKNSLLKIIAVESKKKSNLSYSKEKNVLQIFHNMLHKTTHSD